MANEELDTDKIEWIRNKNKSFVARSGENCVCDVTFDFVLSGMHQTNLAQRLFPLFPLFRSIYCEIVLFIDVRTLNRCNHYRTFNANIYRRCGWNNNKSQNHIEAATFIQINNKMNRKLSEFFSFCLLPLECVKPRKKTHTQKKPIYCARTYKYLPLKWCYALKLLGFELFPMYRDAFLSSKFAATNEIVFWKLHDVTIHCFLVDKPLQRRFCHFLFVCLFVYLFCAQSCAFVDPALFFFISFANEPFQFVLMIQQIFFIWSIVQQGCALSFHSITIFSHVISMCIQTGIVLFSVVQFPWCP